MPDFDLDKALKGAYKSALDSIIAKNKKFLKKWHDVQTGKYPCPEYWKSIGKQDYWRRGFLNELARQYNVSQQIVEELSRAGGKASTMIEKTMFDEYGHGYQGELLTVQTEAAKAGLVMNPVIDTRAVEIAINDAEVLSPLSKIRFAQLGRSTQVRQRLQRELGASIAAGESRAKLIQRIMNVVGNAEYNAKRTAQTELNRVRNQSAYEADQYAEQAYGLQLERTWHCRFVNSRDGHMAADGTKATSKTDSVTQDDDTGWWIDGELLRFPGDPRASAHNVINCHCQVVTHVATNSPAMRKLRAENEAKRAEWVQQNKPHNKDDENWRRGSK